MARLSAEGTFTVTSFDAVDWTPEIACGVPVGHARMVKEFEGDVAGRAVTQFSYAFDQDTNTGTYVALESFDGSVLGRRGACAFVHSATAIEGDETTRHDEFFQIVPGSGTGDLTGITGSGAIAVDPDGTHRIRLDHRLPEPTG